jgi:hypothetical protein
MKIFVRAYAISTSHINEKVNVLNVKDLARSSKINLWSKQWHPISKWTSTKWHIKKHYASIKNQQGNICYDYWNK